MAGGHTNRTVTARSRKTFGELVTLPDLGIPLAETALLMACEEYPHLSLKPYLDRLDELAERVDQRRTSGDEPVQTIGVINDVLFGDEGFSGNTTDYYDPRNSFLNDVLDRRTGIPITLSTIYIEVSRRVGFRVDGVGIPGHFVVKHVDGPEEIFIDPFHGGSILTRAECRTLALRNHPDESAETDPEEVERWLRRVGHRQIVIRMLNNLKIIYLKGGAFDKALGMLELMVLAEPLAPVLYKERGMIRLGLRRYREAAADLERYLEMAPAAEDREEVGDHVKDIRRIRAMMN
jgi:regulator of sirC expression with transglutaminase-like and TPR domain